MLRREAMLINSSFEHGGFAFTVKAAPRLELALPANASDEQLLAFELAKAAGVRSVCAVLGAVERVVGWRCSVRAETKRSWQEALDLAWPCEVHVNLANDGEATLVCHAAAELPAGSDLLEAMAKRLALEGPIGAEAASAFLAGSLGQEPAP